LDLEIWQRISAAYDPATADGMNEEGIGGSVMLPGTARPADRFVRVSYYLQQAPKTSDRREAVAAMFWAFRT
jgi:penicillin V acylase-like amidase (Ntn superfamily)